MISFRKATTEDMAFIADSFLDSFKNAHAAGLICADDWRVVMQRQFSRFLARPGVQLWVASHPGDDSHVADLYGWAAVEHSEGTPYLIYCYIKQPYRRMGIARSLLAKAGIDGSKPWEYAAKTGIVTKLLPKLTNGRWNPMRIRFPARKV